MESDQSDNLIVVKKLSVTDVARNFSAVLDDPHVRVNDLWLAAQAIQRGFRLLTSNAKDVAAVPGLQMVVLKLP